MLLCVCKQRLASHISIQTRTHHAHEGGIVHQAARSIEPAVKVDQLHVREVVREQRRGCGVYRGESEALYVTEGQSKAAQSRE